jgi:hypothetical protein
MSISTITQCIAPSITESTLGLAGIHVVQEGTILKRRKVALAREIVIVQAAMDPSFPLILQPIPVLLGGLAPKTREKIEGELLLT